MYHLAVYKRAVRFFKCMHVNIEDKPTCHSYLSDKNTSCVACSSAPSSFSEPQQGFIFSSFSGSVTVWVGTVVMIRIQRIWKYRMHYVRCGRYNKLKGNEVCWFCFDFHILWSVREVTSVSNDEKQIEMNMMMKV